MTKYLRRVRVIGTTRLAFVFPATFLFLCVQCLASGALREKLPLDFDWKFHLGNEWGIGHALDKAGTGTGPANGVSFSDASWRTVNLPHDWVVELPFDPKANERHGFYPIGPGYPSNSVAWYRRAFELPKEDSGKRLWLEFDGVFRDATVFVNGWYVGHHEGGYDSFRYDITDVAKCGGKNVVAVKVDASEFEGWFYEGAGIYRHVWLETTSPLAIGPDGIFVHAQFENNVPTGHANVHIESEIFNAQSAPAKAAIRHEIFGPDGTRVARTTSRVVAEPWLKQDTKCVVSVREPRLWSPESPNLYKLITTVESEGRIVDQTETEFGIRTIAFDANKGFLLNGKPYVIKGACNHQDHAGVGVALPDRLQYFRVAKLKEMGGNAYRTAHNPPTPELLEACDRLGMLVLNEARLLGSDAENLERLSRHVIRDRNHPSVFLWSIANEEFGVQGTPAGVRAAVTMQHRVKQLDPTRSVTYASPTENKFAGTINSVVEVRGWNYHFKGQADAYHREHPGQPNVGTEVASALATRGIYAEDKARGYVSAYDENHPVWGSTAEEWWTFFSERAWLSGGFIWTGFDYRGEPTPYVWPCISSHFGVLDTCGFPKDAFWYYQSWWTTNPVLHLLPHWNWPGKAGQEIRVDAFSNCEQVELLLNGKSLGTQSIRRNSHASWKVRYEPGALTAKGFHQGKLVSETKVETTGEPAAIQLTPDRAAIHADGADVSVITVAVTDAQGRIVPTAADKIHFELLGEGKILGVGNGDPSCHEPDQFLAARSHSIMALDNWRWKRLTTDLRAGNLPETARAFDDSAWSNAVSDAASGPLGERDKGVFRTHVTLTEADLANEAIELNVGCIQEEGWVYVNGQLAGESHDSKSPAGFEVKRFLRAGDNTIAVATMNWFGNGGISKGAWLRCEHPPAKAAWQRSVFNGLAQVIVQSSKQPGEIRLTARGENLAAATTIITSKPAGLKP